MFCWQMMQGVRFIDPSRARPHRLAPMGETWVDGDDEYADADNEADTADDTGDADADEAADDDDAG